jgi:hypothetical protein
VYPTRANRRIWMLDDASARRWLSSNVQTQKLACVSRNSIVPTTG